MESAEAISLYNHEHSPFLRLPAEVRNLIYRFAIGREPTDIIESMDYLDGLQAQVALLQVCRHMYFEAVPLVLALRELVLGRNKATGHGKRMGKVLDRILCCPLAGHIGAMAFRVESDSAVDVGGELRLCRKLVNMVTKLRGLRGLRRITVTCPKKWRRSKAEAFRVKLEQVLCEGADTRDVAVKITGGNKEKSYGVA